MSQNQCGVSESKWPMHSTHPDVILYIERQENVNGDSLAKYLMEFVLEMLENHQTREVHEGQEEVVLADPRDVEYLNELGIDNQENQNGQQIDHQEEDEMGNENDENEIDTPKEPLEDTELHDQMEERDCQSTRNPVEAPTVRAMWRKTNAANYSIFIFYSVLIRF